VLRLFACFLGHFPAFLPAFLGHSPVFWPFFGPSLTANAGTLPPSMDGNSLISLYALVQILSKKG
jgi:hypothetical protein